MSLVIECNDADNYLYW